MRIRPLLVQALLAAAPDGGQRTARRNARVATEEAVSRAREREDAAASRATAAWHGSARA